MDNACVNKLLKKVAGHVQAQMTSGRAAADRAVKRIYLCFRMLNVLNNLLTHKYTQHAQLHAYGN